MVVLDEDPAQLILFAKSLLVVPILYAVSCCLSRLTPLIFLLRVFINKTEKRLTLGLMVLLILHALAIILSILLACRPLSAIWDKTIGGTCFNIKNWDRYITLPNVPIDLGILILPLPLVWKLHAPRRVKIGLVFTFLTGSMYVSSGGD